MYLNVNLQFPIMCLFCLIVVVCIRYIESSSSPKNVVILVDTSGSMKGLRMEITRSTIERILETFSNKDYFNIITVSSTDCYAPAVKWRHHNVTHIRLSDFNENSHRHSEPRYILRVLVSGLCSKCQVTVAKYRKKIVNFNRHVGGAFVPMFYSLSSFV